MAVSPFSKLLQSHVWRVAKTACISFSHAAAHIRMRKSKLAAHAARRTVVHSPRVLYMPRWKGEERPPHASTSSTSPREQITENLQPQLVWYLPWQMRSTHNTPLSWPTGHEFCTLLILKVVAESAGQKYRRKIDQRLLE